MRRLGFVSALALVLSLAVAVAGTASAAVPRTFYGIVRFAPLTSGDFARMGGAHVGTLRMGIGWQDVQPSRGGPYNFSAVDGSVRNAAAQGITVLPILANIPTYLHKNCGTDQGCLRHIYLSTAEQRAGWQQFVAHLAQRYGPGGAFWQQNPGLPQHPITTWQLWNEQNAPNQHNTPKLYAKLLKLTDAALSGPEPNAKIILGGMYGTPKGSKKFAAWRYLGSLYKYGAKRHFNAVANHPYSPTLDGIKFQIKKLRSVLVKHHDKKKKLYVTEIGWGSSRKAHAGTGKLGAQFNVGPKKQAKDLKASFKLLTSHRKKWKIGGVDWFTWKDPTNPPAGLCAFCYSSGLYKANGTTAKPALRAYKSFTRKASG